VLVLGGKVNDTEEKRKETELVCIRRKRETTRERTEKKGQVVGVTITVTSYAIITQNNFRIHPAGLTVPCVALLFFGCHTS
jgi:hypothetical protein